MYQDTNIGVDLDKELEKIEDEISEHNRIIDNLTWQRSELLTKKQDLDMCELFDCITEKGLTASEALDILNSVDYIRRHLTQN